MLVMKDAQQHGMTSARTSSTRFWGGASALALGLVLGSVARLAAASAPDSTSAQTVSLEYREVKSSLINWSFTATPQAAPFKVEPKLNNRKIIRGVWTFGNETAHTLPWIWDSSEGKLYLDLNRNRDLTDDPAGVYSCHEGAKRSKYSQTFTDVRLTFKTPTGEHRVMGDVSLYNYNFSSGVELRAYFACRSFFAGRFSARGRDWELGLVNALTDGKIGSPDGGYFVVRRWEARDELLDVQNGALDGFPFCRSVFFGKQSYQLSCTCTQLNGLAKYDLKLVEEPKPLGELKLTGKYIKRLLLKQQGRTPGTVVLDMPDQVVQVPVGKYETPPEVVLKQGGVEASRQGNRYPRTGSGLVITTNQPAVLAIGGPLTNSMTAGRRGQTLNLRYQLVGVGGDVYQLQGARKEPEFAVYRANKKIASGNFEFG